ncbi:hypothetical protein BJV78DRAFT_1208842 [Lactifluus subvellereus]|nr:hypothetical protein BJV78DRAFT_1208842 [Lactifluus subvellereus]
MLFFLAHCCEPHIRFRPVFFFFMAVLWFSLSFILLLTVTSGSSVLLCSILFICYTPTTSASIYTINHPLDRQLNKLYRSPVAKSDVSSTSHPTTMYYSGMF